MSQSVPSYATPAMLEWARVQSRMSVEDVAKAEGVSIHDIDAWESGNVVPSLARLRNLAARYKYPLMVFYLAEPPKGFAVVRDFRRFHAGELSPALAFAIRYAQQRQAWAAEYLEEIDSPKVPLIGSISRDGKTKEIAQSLRTALGVSVEAQSACPSADKAFLLWRAAVESAGIMVFQAPGVEVKEMRGFALPDDLAPVAVVNSRDAATAKCFTLLHEVVHLMLGESALTGSGRAGTELSLEEETFCNSIAAEALVPEDDFRLRIPDNWRFRIDEVLRRTAERYHVSRAVIAVRLYETGMADKQFLKDKLPMLRAKARKGGAIRTQDERAVIRSGIYFSRLAVSAYHGDIVPASGFTTLLGLKLKHLPALESRLFPD